MLQGAANIIFKYQSKKGEFAFLRDFLDKNEVSNDVNLLIS